MKRALTPTLTPTLSRRRERESFSFLSRLRERHPCKFPLPLAGEG